MSQLLEWIWETWGEVIRERPELNVWEYARENVVFDAKMGNITGPWRADLTPYTLLFQELITNHFSTIPEEDWWLQNLVARGERCDEAFIVKSSQSGFTQAALNACVYIPQFDPGRLLYVMDSREKAKKVIKLRLIPFLQRLCGSVIADEKDVNATMIELTSMIMEFCGSFSSGMFSEKPLRYGFVDDVEYMVAEGGLPGMLDGIHVIDHVRSRFTTSDNSFLGVFSKPNLESSEFITNHKGGSQHGFWVPCPHCNARQILEPEGLNFSHRQCKDLAGRYDLEAVEELTTYLCARCKKDIEEANKYSMNQAGILIPKSKERRIKDDDPALVPRRFSMTINDLNSQFPGVKWGKLARMLIESQNNPAKAKFVMTNHFARPWKEHAINIKGEQVRAICAGAIDPKTGQHYPDDVDGDGRLKVPEYKRGECPFIPDFLFATSDVQGDKYKYGIAGFKLNGIAALIEYGACLTTSELYEMMQDPRSHTGSPLVCLPDPDRPMIIEHGLIDSGHDTFTIYEFCIRTGWIWYPSKGVGGLNMAGRMVEGKEDFYEGQPILRYHYNDFQTKVNYYHNKIVRAHHPQNRSARLYLPSDIGDDFVIEQISESLMPMKLSGGVKKMEWVHDKKIGPNDWGDMMKMMFVGDQIIRPILQAEVQRRQPKPQIFTNPPPVAGIPITGNRIPSLAEVLASLKK